MKADSGLRFYNLHKAGRARDVELTTTKVWGILWHNYIWTIRQLIHVYVFICTYYSLTYMF